MWYLHQCWLVCKNCDYCIFCSVFVIWTTFCTIRVISPFQFGNCQISTRQLSYFVVTVVTNYTQMYEFYCEHTRTKSDRKLHLNSWTFWIQQNYRYFREMAALVYYGMQHVLQKQTHHLWANFVWKTLSLRFVAKTVNCLQNTIYNYTTWIILIKLSEFKMNKLTFNYYSLSVRLSTQDYLPVTWKWITPIRIHCDQKREFPVFVINYLGKPDLRFDHHLNSPRRHEMLQTEFLLKTTANAICETSLKISNSIFSH